MAFLSPFWLIALLPWAAVTLWVLLNRGRRTFVPFVELWRGPVAPPRPPRRVRVPSIGIIALLVAALCTILAAAGPVLNRAGGAAVRLIVDRGLTMSGRGDGDLRFRNMIDLVRPHVGEARNVEVEVVPSRGGDTTTLDQARSMPPTAVDTAAELDRAVRRATEGNNERVIVLSDRRIDTGNLKNQPAWLRPQRLPTDVRIDVFSVNERPRKAVMVRLTNDSDVTETRLVLEGDTERQERQIRLPARGQSIDVFFDVREIGDVLKASIDAEDDIQSNNVAWLTRSGAAAALEARSTLPPELTRMMEVYRRSRGAGGATADAPPIVVVDSLFRLPQTTRGVALLTGVPDVSPISERSTLAIEDHALTRDVDWRVLSRGARAAGAPGEGWLPLVASDGRVLLAVREGATRQVWVGFVSDTAALTPDYVVLWTKIFDWLGAAEGGFRSELIGTLPVSDLRPSGNANRNVGLWAGIVTKRNGQTVALNDPPLDVGRETEAMSSAQQQAVLSRVTETSQLSISFRMALLSVGFILAAFAFYVGVAPREPARVAVVA